MTFNQEIMVEQLVQFEMSYFDTNTEGERQRMYEFFVQNSPQNKVSAPVEAKLQKDTYEKAVTTYYSSLAFQTLANTHRDILDGLYDEGE